MLWLTLVGIVLRWFDHRALKEWSDLHYAREANFFNEAQGKC
jgi:hypothetical protein